MSTNRLFASGLRHAKPTHSKGQPHMPIEQISKSKIFEYLETTPQCFANLTKDLEPRMLRMTPAPGEWSFVEVLAHLRCCADLWGRYIQRILDEDQPAIRAVSPRRFLKQTDYPDLEFQPSFDAFIRQRTDLLDLLTALPPRDWQRVAMVTSVGKPIERSIHNYAERLAIHERSHYRQLRGLSEDAATMIDGKVTR